MAAKSTKKSKVDTRKSVTKRAGRAPAKGQIGAPYVRRGAKRITPKEVKEVVDRSSAIEDKVRSSGVLRRLLDDVKLMLSAVSDYYHGRYREIPWATIAAIVFALAYVFSPIDLIPDVIPILGLTDDAAVVAACLFLVKDDLAAYAAWKRRTSRK